MDYSTGINEFWRTWGYLTLSLYFIDMEIKVEPSDDESDGYEGKI